MFPNRPPFFSWAGGRLGWGFTLIWPRVGIVKKVEPTIPACPNETITHTRRYSNTCVSPVADAFISDILTPPGRLANLSAITITSQICDGYARLSVDTVLITAMAGISPERNTDIVASAVGPCAMALLYNCGQDQGRVKDLWDMGLI